MNFTIITNYNNFSNNIIITNFSNNIIIIDNFINLLN